MKYVTLNNEVKMPILGFGVYQIDDLEECEKCVSNAIEVGYRSIDTAQAYGNEKAVGRAVKKSGISREEFFLTTKVWISNAGYEKAKQSIEESLKKLETDYIDLLLIHQPFNDYYGTYRAMEEYYKKGKIRTIGVSNFYPDRFIDLAQFCEVTPAVNQVETHVFNQQKEAQEIMNKYGTQMESWGPFAEGKNDFFNNPVLKEIGEKYSKSAAQVALRYLIQRNVVVIPKTVNKDRMMENITVLILS
jgi:2,5-diketo-D-gluconate reductase A